ncbi:tRNA lysidine(34) synthetase TilS [Asticcacaulis tiandongensis]|uniref:tRNA lysidine(34) synthetase TilS n=1 Tax=Asticcacaulis tiandongensis TaxID=2565365 RepID=UPI00112917F0|nr:tRNA lysidine(34) synthetase TilS [Asticcacaulis tiandongensis]
MHLSLKARIDKANQTCPDVWAGFLRGLNPLDAACQTPLGVMVSGGGDSIALLHLLWFWGQRPLHVFCVDHGLNPQSAHWTQTVQALCTDLRLGFTPLKWQGDKPVTGIQAAARQARHTLINQAARAKNIQILCLGHNADDGQEAALMRDMGSSVSAPKAWGPSPLWPEGRDLFYLRPVLGVGRARLREWLKVAGIAYIDDPANDNPAYLRSLARRTLTETPVIIPENQSPAGARPPVPAHDLISGSLRFEYKALLDMPMADARHVIACALVCAGGGIRLPRQDSLWTIYEALRLLDSLNHSLCGARVWRLSDQVIFGRNSGEFARNPLPPVTLRAGETVIWDGRFEITAGGIDGDIMPLKGQMRHLAAQDVQALKALPAALRAGVPVWRDVSGVLHLSPTGGEVKSLVHRRFCAHAGLWRHEAEINT